MTSDRMYILRRRRLTRVLPVLVLLVFFFFIKDRLGMEKGSLVQDEIRDRKLADINSLFYDEEKSKPVYDSSSEETMNIILSVDKKEYKYLPIVMNSVLLNTNATVHMYISVCNVAIETVRSYVSCFNFDHEKIKLFEFPTTYLDDDFRSFMRRRSVKSNQASYLSNCANYARFFFTKIFPTLDKAIYLDVDMLVVGDLKKVWRATLHENSIIAPIERKKEQGVSIRKADVLSQRADHSFAERYNRTYDWRRNNYNCGIFFVNLDKWRKQENYIYQEIHFWMKNDIESRFSILGTQPLMWLVFHNTSSLLPSAWYVGKLGKLGKICGETPLRKPWMRGVAMGVIWQSFYPATCNGAADCKVKDRNVWQCV